VPLEPAKYAALQAAEKVVEGAKGSPRAQHIFNDLTARLKWVRKKSDCTLCSQRLKAAIDVARPTARLKPRPFKAKSKPEFFRNLYKLLPFPNPASSRVFPQAVEPRFVWIDRHGLKPSPCTKPPSTSIRTWLDRRFPSVLMPDMPCLKGLKRVLAGPIAMPSRDH